MDQEYQNILVPVDGSKESELALERAIFVAKRNGAHVDVLKTSSTLGQWPITLQGCQTGALHTSWLTSPRNTLASS